MPCFQATNSIYYNDTLALSHTRTHTHTRAHKFFCQTVSQINTKDHLIQQINHFRFGEWCDLSSSPLTNTSLCNSVWPRTYERICLRGSLPLLRAFQAWQGRRGTIHQMSRNSWMHSMVFHRPWSNIWPRIVFFFISGKGASNRVCSFSRREKKKNAEGDKRTKIPQENSKWKRKAEKEQLKHVSLIGSLTR